MSAGDTITHVQVVDPAGGEFASEQVNEGENVVTLREPIVYRQRGSSQFTLLSGVKRLSIPYVNVKRIEVWDAEASEV